MQIPPVAIIITYGWIRFDTYMKFVKTLSLPEAREIWVSFFAISILYTDRSRNGRKLPVEERLMGRDRGKVGEISR
jgi:hypothetical protein